MNNEIISKELESTLIELGEEYRSETDPSALLNSLNAAVLQISQTAIDNANNTESFDEKIQALVTGIQECVRFVGLQKTLFDERKTKYEHQLEIVNRLQSRVSDIDYVMEKKIEGQEAEES